MLRWIGSTLLRRQDSSDDVAASPKYGWVRDLPDFRDHNKEFESFSDTSSVDLRAKCPAVYNQGKLGSCTANAIAGAYEFDMMSQGEESVFTPSRLFIYFNERSMEGTTGTDSGAQIRDGIKSVSRQGVVPEDVWPYTVSSFDIRPPDSLYDEAELHTAISYSRVKQDIRHIKQCLADGYPVVFGFSVYESSETESVAETGMMPVPKKSERLLGGHAVLAVGYDDTQEMITVRNSWGTEWGDNGYFYMPYKVITDAHLAGDFWTIRRVKDATD